MMRYTLLSIYVFRSTDFDEAAYQHDFLSLPPSLVCAWNLLMINSLCSIVSLQTLLIIMLHFVGLKLSAFEHP